MKRVLIVFSLGFTLLASCNPDPAEYVPKDIIPKSKMKEILNDVFIAEASLTEMKVPQDSVRYKSALYYEAICRKHGITRPEFTKSLKYYTRHPQVFERAMSEVVDSLAVMQAREK